MIEPYPVAAPKGAVAGFRLSGLRLTAACPVVVWPQRWTR